ncbi:hypothetical protein AAMO2058_001139800 [Amorphochlora amoebiformis]
MCHGRVTHMSFFTCGTTAGHRLQFGGMSILILLVIIISPSAASSEALCFPKYSPGYHVASVSDPLTGKERSVMVHVPDNLDFVSFSSVPAMIAYHGWHANPWYFNRLGNVAKSTARHGMVLALGFGTPPDTNESPICCPDGCDVMCCSSGDKLDMMRPCGWNTDGQGSTGTDDIAYTRAIARMLVKDLCVDSNRIFATGLSNGGSMTATAACQASDVFAGVAQISGGLGEKVICEPESPVAFLSFCGLDDMSCTASSNTTAELFKSLNNCIEPFHTSFESKTTKCRAARGCMGGTFVEQCFIKGLGDEFPGHDRVKPLYPGEPKQDPNNIDAMDYMLKRMSIISKQESKQE